jgi:hypothetical protein
MVAAETSRDQQEKEETKKREVYYIKHYVCIARAFWDSCLGGSNMKAKVLHSMVWAGTEWVGSDDTRWLRQKARRRHLVQDRQREMCKTWHMIYCIVHRVCCVCER